MQSRRPLFAILALLLVGCAAGNDPVPTELGLNVDQAPTTAQPPSAVSRSAGSRPFGPITSGDSHTLTLSSYVNGLYHQFLGRSASSTEIADAESLYTQGATIQQVVQGILNSDPQAQSYVSSLPQKMASDRGGRGFGNNDLILYYLLASYYGAGGSNSYSTLNLALPYLLNTKQYYSYLLYSLL